MLLRYPFFGLVLTCFVFTALTPSNVYAKPGPQFRIGSFLVEMGRFGMEDDRTGRLPARPRPPSPSMVNPNDLSDIELKHKIFTGYGKTSIANKEFSVEFKGIRLKRGSASTLPFPRLQKRVLTATAGTVSGRDYDTSVIWYKKDSFDVQVKTHSVRITTKTAMATVMVTVPAASFSSSISKLSLYQEEDCAVASDGSVFGQNFRGSADIKLKDLNYMLRIRGLEPQIVRLGATFKPPQYSELEGVSLKGRARRDGIVAFSFEGTISSALTSDFKLALDKVITSIPEPDYKIIFNLGSLSASYTKAGLEDFHGSFNVNLHVPDSIITSEGQSIDVLEQIALDTDRSDALFHKIYLPHKIPIGNHFSIEPDHAVDDENKDTNGTWAYFPVWPIDGTSHSSFAGYEKDQPCDQLQELLETKGRPGLTVFSGTFFLDSPQVTKPGGNSTTPIKTVFAGHVTLTRWGFTGFIRGKGASFVRVEQDLSLGRQPNTPPRSTWQEIKNKGIDKPEELEERFQLAGLKLLDMQVRSMRFCKNNLVKETAEFNYVVHFPYPSYIHLVFEDKSLTKEGIFTKAAGPLSTSTNVDDITEGEIPEGSKIPDVIHNPDTHILWAWRLPVSFAYRNVLIRLSENAPYSARANVLMNEEPIEYVGIRSSEIWLKPLFSRNSAVKAGVRFGATMHHRTGDFELTEIDRQPILAPMYPNPGAELRAGFAVQLDDGLLDAVGLARLPSNPVTRPYDFWWAGKIQFPFFTKEPIDTWKELSFVIKDLTPGLREPLYIGSEKPGRLDCDPAASTCVSSEPSEPGLRVIAANLIYSPDNRSFISTNLQAFDLETPPRDLEPISLTMSSYTNAAVRTDSPAPAPEPIELGEDNSQDGDCGRTIWVRRVLLNPQDSSAFKDLVCYDERANCARGTCGSCSDSYKFGTYEVQTHTAPSDWDNAKTVVSIPNVKYYDITKKIDVDFADITVKSDEMKDPYPIVVSVTSGNNIALDPTGRYLEGDFGATNAQIAAAQPYSGRFRFKLDTKCGYYYFYSAGTFTYVLTFQGQTFIVHAPYKFLTAANPFSGTTSILESLGVFAMLDDADEFAGKAGMSGLNPNTLISGILTSANARWGYDWLYVQVGPGSYVYQISEAGRKEYRAGFFAELLAKGEVDLKLGSVMLKAQSGLSGKMKVPKSLTALDNIMSGSFEAKGDLTLEACAGFDLGHCSAGVEIDAVYSSDSGLDLGDIDPSGGCGTGGC